MASFNKKIVTFNECITVWDYEYDPTKEKEDKKGCDWIRTQDLTCREFKLPEEKGGCGGDWNVLERKLDELAEPYWCLIGQLWQQLFPGEKRLEEILLEYEDSLSEDDDYIEKKRK